jgi:hypothetical protein
VAVLAGTQRAAAAPCSDDGCTWNDDPPLPAAGPRCATPAVSAASEAMRRVTEHWLRDHGNGCMIDESGGRARLIVYPPAGVSAAAFRADVELMRAAYQAAANGSGHGAWAADFDRIAYDFCKRIGHDTIAMIAAEEHCPGARGEYALVRYATHSSVGRAQRAREHFLIQLSQPTTLPDLVGGKCPRGEQCAFVAP